MRQASWNDMFAPRSHGAAIPAPEVPQEPQGWRRFFWWEEWLTFALLGVIILVVIASVDRAHWVDGMPSLYTVAFFGLAMGALLSRLSWKEGFIHLVALPLGAAASLGQILSVLPGHYPWDRYDVLHERMADWFHIAFYGGISDDELPFVVLVVPSAWLAGYLSSWAVFRWRNAWLALVPAGAVLLTNIAFLPGGFTLPVVVFMIGGTVLVTRMHLVERAKAWRDDGTPYPPMLSLSVFHASLWAAAALALVAWLMPRAHESSAIDSVWNDATAPLSQRVERFGRLFIAVDNKNNARVHNFNDFQAFLGSIDLSDVHVLDAQTGEELVDPAFLRAQAYYYYSSTGWSEGDTNEFVLPEGARITADEEAAREDQGLTIISGGDTGDTLFTLGQPLRVDRPARYEANDQRADVTGVESTRDLRSGTKYRTVGSTSIASEADLRNAGTNYPDWVSRYLQIPDGFSPRVQGLARNITTAPPSGNPYDNATAVESYLRAIPYDLNVPKPPRGVDPIWYFLFDAKRGYFDYHASVMVMMLRSVDIPARLAVGYALQSGDFDREAGTYRVTEASAYAWPEVYFPGFGWVEFNPTPNLPSIARTGGQGQVAVPSGSTSPAEPVDLNGLLDDLPHQPDAQSPALSTATSNGHTQWIVFGIVTAVALLFTSLASGAGYLWMRGLAALDEPARLWEQTVRLASWARLAPQPEQTPREYAASLRSRVDGVEGADALADAYVRHQFGHQAIEPAERNRLDAAWRVVRGRLLRRMLRLG